MPLPIAQAADHPPPVAIGILERHQGNERAEDAAYCQKSAADIIRGDSTFSMGLGIPSNPDRRKTESERPTETILGSDTISP